MEYKGRKIGFKRTVGAVSDLAKMAPDGKMERFGEMFSEQNLSVSLEAGARFLAILNKWYENSLVFTESGYVPDPVPLEWFMSLDYQDYMALLEEAMKTFAKDDAQTVEAVEPKGKKNE